MDVINYNWEIRHAGSPVALQSVLKQLSMCGVKDEAIKILYARDGIGYDIIFRMP